MQLINALNDYRELVLVLCSMGIFHIGAWYGRTTERSEQQRRDRARSRFNYRNK